MDHVHHFFTNILEHTKPSTLLSVGDLRIGAGSAAHDWQKMNSDSSWWHDNGYDLLTRQSDFSFIMAK